jgi:uncharacterized protein YbjT (DUF2867 family)
MSTFVTGGTGKIGQELVKLLVAHGVNTTVFVRDASKVPPGAKAVVGDLDAIASFSAAVKVNLS